MINTNKKRSRQTIFNVRRMAKSTNELILPKNRHVFTLLKLIFKKGWIYHGFGG